MANGAVDGTDPTGAESVSEPKLAWNSLEAAKLAVAVLTPVMVFWFGVTLKQMDDARVARERGEDAVREDKEKTAERRQAAALAAAEAERQRRYKLEDVQRQQDAGAAQRARDDAIRYADQRLADELRKRDEQHRTETEATEGARLARLDDDRVYQQRQDSFKAIAKIVTERHLALDQVRAALDQYSGKLTERVEIDQAFKTAATVESTWKSEMDVLLAPFSRSVGEEEFTRLRWVTRNALWYAYDSASYCMKREWTWKSTKWFASKANPKPEFVSEGGCQLVTGNLVTEDQCREGYIYYLSSLATQGKVDFGPGHCDEVEKNNREIMRLSLEEAVGKFGSRRD